MVAVILKLVLVSGVGQVCRSYLAMNDGNGRKSKYVAVARIAPSTSSGMEVVVTAQMKE